VVTKQIWLSISQAVGTVCDSDYVSSGNLWLSKKKLLVANMFTFVLLIMFLLVIYGLVKRSC
jgi:hypothetical protein